MIKNASNFLIIFQKNMPQVYPKIEIIVLYEILLNKYLQTASSLLKATKKFATLSSYQVNISLFLTRFSSDGVIYCKTIRLENS